MRLLKVSGLSKNCAKKINPRLSRIIFQNIAEMYREIKQKETLQVTLIIQNLKLPIKSVKTGDQIYYHASSPPLSDLLVQLNIPGDQQKVPSDLQDILLHP